jgi:hypothetical protein
MCKDKNIDINFKNRTFVEPKPDKPITAIIAGSPSEVSMDPSSSMISAFDPETEGFGEAAGLDGTRGVINEKTIRWWRQLTC